MLKKTIFSGTLLILSPLFAFAGGLPIPGPIAGAAGPWGLAVVGGAYVGYRVIKRLRNR